VSSRGDITALVGDDLGDLEFVARGGSAAVYRATQRSLGRRVAVKVFDSIDLRGDRALTEARAQAAMSWHANVVTLFGTTTDAYCQAAYGPDATAEAQLGELIIPSQEFWYCNYPI
jgi:hypothetical protein